MRFKLGSIEFKKISWVFYSQLFQIISQIINIVFLTRLFSPKDYGIFAVGMIIISIVNQLFVLGFSAPLIQFDNHKRYYGTAWTFNLFISTFVTILLLLLIPVLIDAFFSQYYDYVYLFQYLTLSILISGLGNIGVIELYRNRQTYELFYLRGFLEFLKVVLTFFYFYLFQDYRALFYSFLTTSLVKLTLTYTISPIKIKFEMNLELLKKLFNFSKWIQLKNITKVISDQFDSIIIASLLIPINLGVYNRSMIISKVPEQLFSNVNDIYSYPLISGKKDNFTFIKKFFISYIMVLVMIVSNIALLVNLFGKEIIKLILGDAWGDISEPLNILILTMCISSILNTFFPFLRAKGYPKVEFKLFLLRTLIIVIITYPLVLHYGLVGAAVSNLIAVILVVPIFINYTKKIIGKYVSTIYGIMLVWFIIAFSIFSLYEFHIINITELILNILGILITYNFISIFFIVLFFPKTELVMYIKSFFSK